MEKLKSIENIFRNGTWYHSVEYNNIKSKGTFDYTQIIKDLNFPSMKNMDVLDVGCSDGFFSKYFLEELDANHVLGIDINNYDGSIAFDVLSSFEKEYEEKYKSHNDFDKLKEDYEILGLNNSNKFLLLKNLFNLNMDYKNASIYDMKNLENRDVTFCGSLLEHLRDPISAIEQLYFKTNNFCIIDVSNTFKSSVLFPKPYLKYTGAGGNFYNYSDEAIKLMMKAVGFKNIKTLKNYRINIEKYNYKIRHTLFIGYK